MQAILASLLWRRSSTRQLKGPAIEYTLDLGNHNLNGPIPENLADLAQLQCLVLSHNNLSGSIPSKSSLSFSQFGDSLKLQGLYLGKNQLSGTIPERLGRLSSLVKLNFTIEEAVTEQAVTESAAIEPPSVGRRTTGSGSSYLISSGHWASSSFPSFSSFSSQGSKLNLKEKEMREAAGLHFRSGNQRVKKPVVLSDPETGKKELGIELGELSCPVDAVNPIAKISPKKKEKNAKVKTSEISLVYFYLKIDRKFPFFFLEDRTNATEREGMESDLS
ncbi:hypothetical protein QVD17_12103 [Tagetes erecta]|uniref:Uncharacterized protein n=1 Tax=Tagetes erecta TaxID=13708 RepID=A0AAD8P2R3_TARER|nr:hypothetical protein QVD17_12103 [Tagetes erecta]